MNGYRVLPIFDKSIIQHSDRYKKKYIQTSSLDTQTLRFWVQSSDFSLKVLQNLDLWWLYHFCTLSFLFCLQTSTLSKTKSKPPKLSQGNPPTEHLYKYLMTSSRNSKQKDCTFFFSVLITWWKYMQNENIAKFTLTFYIYKCQFKNWKQNRDESGSRVNHREWCSQRLVTKILKPLWNRL